MKGAEARTSRMESGWTLGLGLGERPEKGQMGLEPPLKGPLVQGDDWQKGCRELGDWRKVPHELLAPGQPPGRDC